MKPAPFNLLLETASRDNILVLTTNCSTSCVFCSHLQNPPEIEAYYVDKLSRDQINTLVEFLDGSRKIVIGESATRICEGEPFLREDILDILHDLRKRYKNTAIQITTSGIHLNNAVLAELKDIGNIELNVSLNSSTIEGRERLYRGKAHWSAVEAVKLLQSYGIGYSGSVVAMPHLVGWEDIKAAVLFLDKYGADTIRIFMPGYTRFTKGILPPADIRSGLKELAAELKSTLDTPVILEPSGVKDLDAVAEGVLRGSHAWDSGLVKGDRILRIDGKEAVSRVDAYYRLFKACDPRLEILRQGMPVDIVVRKPAKTSSGLVFNYDIHPDEIIAIEKAILRNRGSRCLLLTSELARPILAAGIKQDGHTLIEAARNSYFGGNIMCAGLLTVSDIEVHMAGRAEQVDVLLLPGIMFDSAGRDLLGRHYEEIEEKLGIRVEVI